MDYTHEIRKFVVENFLFGEKGNLEDDTLFIENAIVDSTGILELVMFLENTYGIKVEPDELLPANLDSISRVSKFVASKQAITLQQK
jgi:acyl carrier protein